MELPSRPPCGSRWHRTMGAVFRSPPVGRGHQVWACPRVGVVGAPGSGFGPGVPRPIRSRFVCDPIFA
eukprot:4150687-Pyramimonas_sp.AAC.1